MFYNINEVIEKEKNCLSMLLEHIDKLYPPERNDSIKGLYRRDNKKGTVYHLSYYDADGKRKSKKLGNENAPEVIAIKQRAWCESLRSILRANLKSLSSISAYHDYDVESIDQTLPSVYKDETGTVTKDVLSSLLSEWGNKNYVRNSARISNKQIDSSGNILRSKSEVVVSEILRRHKVAFHPDAEIRLQSEAGSMVKKTVDYLIKAADGSYIIVEFFGMLDNEDYFENNFANKIKLLQRNGYCMGENLFCFVDRPGGTINAQAISEIIEKIIVPKVSMKKA